MERATAEVFNAAARKPPPPYQPTESIPTDTPRCDQHIPTPPPQNVHLERMTREVEARRHGREAEWDTSGSSSNDAEYKRYRRAVAEYAFLKGRSVGTALQFLAEHEHTVESIELSLAKHREQREELLRMIAKMEGISRAQAAAKHKRAPNPHLEHVLETGSVPSSCPSDDHRRAASSDIHAHGNGAPEIGAAAISGSTSLPTAPLRFDVMADANAPLQLRQLSGSGMGRTSPMGSGAVLGKDDHYRLDII